jgi:hypothetical protein
VAIKELSLFLDKKDYQVAAPILLIVAHQRCSFPGISHDAVEN